MLEKWIKLLIEIDKEENIEKVKDLIRQAESEMEQLEIEIKDLKRVRTRLINKYYDLM